jgi:hypothetical protein
VAWSDLFQDVNLLNVSHAQNMNEAQSQGQLQACMAAQAAVANMDKRNQLPRRSMTLPTSSPSSP